MIGWAIEALVASALLMLGVLIARGPTRRSFGPGVAYALWLVPLLRLLLPPLRGGGLISRWIGEPTSHGLAMGVLNPRLLSPEIARHAVVRIEAGMGGAPVQAIIIPPMQVESGPSLALLLGALCLIGAAVFLGYHLLSHALFCARVRREARRREVIAGRRVELIVSDAVAGPLAFGVWRKYVAFPSDFDDRYDVDEQALALAHELAHHARGDLIANWIALGVLALHWWNPIAWRAFRAFRADQEMACDAAVLAGREAGVRHAYGRAIVKSAHPTLSGGAVSAACHLHTINELKGRLKMLTKDRVSKPRLAGGAAALGAVALLSLAATASGTQAAERLRGQVRAAIAGAPAPLAVPNAPDVPGAPIAPPQAATPPKAPDTPPLTRHRTKVIIASGDGKTKVIEGKPGEDINTVIARELPDGKVKMLVPDISEKDCAGSDDKPIVKNEQGNGKRIIIICRNRIERIAREAEAKGRHAEIVMLRSTDIEGQAKRSALEGVRAARAGIIANGALSDAARAAALKGIDQAIAELEAEAARAK